MRPLAAYRSFPPLAKPTAPSTSAQPDFTSVTVSTWQVKWWCTLWRHHCKVAMGDSGGRRRGASSVGGGGPPGRPALESVKWKEEVPPPAPSPRSKLFFSMRNLNFWHLSYFLWSLLPSCHVPCPHKLPLAGRSRGWEWRSSVVLALLEPSSAPDVPSLSLGFH